MTDVIVVGPGLIGQAIARRVGVGKHVLLADVRKENAETRAETLGKLVRRDSRSPKLDSGRAIDRACPDG